jgi:hypothetical protein
MEFSTENCNYDERRIIIVTTPNDILKIQNKMMLNDIFNYKQYGDSYLFKKYFLDKSDSIKYYDYKLAKQIFKFQQNHPVINTAYGIYDIFPNQYISLNHFHDYFKKEKHMAFIKFCADLGAKEIYLKSVEINNENIKINNDEKNNHELLNIGIKLNNGFEKEKIFILKSTFPEENKEIKECSTPWLDADPTWKYLRDMRVQNHITTYEAEFNYSEDLGITTEFARKLSAINVSVGGELKEMKKIKLIYKIEFW